MRTAAICPTCATYENAVCVLYNGQNLTNINVPTLTNLETALVNIDGAVASLSAYIASVAANPIVLTTTGTSGPATITGNLLNVPEYQPPIQDVLTYGNTTDQELITVNSLTSPLGQTRFFYGGMEIESYALPSYTSYFANYILTLDQSTGFGSYITLPSPNNNAIYSFPNTGGTLALFTDITLQNATAGTNKNLTNELNFQGTGAGQGNTGLNEINAFGQDAAKNNSGTQINAFGSRAGQDNTGSVNNFLGPDSGNTNTGSGNNGLGTLALYNNSGSSVNAFGNQAGLNNTYSYVHLFGSNASATANNQLVLSKDIGTYKARIGYGGITANRLYTLPDASGTIALTNTAWTLAGNAGTTPGTDFIGTTDAKDFVFKTNNTEVLRFNSVSSRADFTTSIFSSTGSGVASSIWAQSGSGANGYAIIGSNSGNKGFLKLSNGTADVTVKATNITATRSLELPDASGNLVLSVNGVPANTSGEITLTASGPVQQVKVSLTSSDILALSSSSGFTLIAAPGAGKYIEVISITGHYNFGTTPYSGGTILYHRLGTVGSSNVQLTGTISNVINQSNNVYYKALTTFSPTSIAADNRPLTIDVGYAGSPTGGDGTLDVYVTYSIVTL